MFENTKAFSSFSVDDVLEAKEFYSERLGLKVSEESEPMSMLQLHITGDQDILVYLDRACNSSPFIPSILNCCTLTSTRR